MDLFPYLQTSANILSFSTWMCPFFPGKSKYNEFKKLDGLRKEIQFKVTWYNNFIYCIIINVLADNC